MNEDVYAGGGGPRRPVSCREIVRFAGRTYDADGGYRSCEPVLCSPDCCWRRWSPPRRRGDLSPNAESCDELFDWLQDAYHYQGFHEGTRFVPCGPGCCNWLCDFNFGRWVNGVPQW